MYDWSVPENSQNFGTGFWTPYPGKYSLTVTDSVGCSATSNTLEYRAINDCYNVKWDFGDGYTKESIVKKEDIHKPVDHLYSDNGNYLVKMMITDQFGNSGIACRNVDIKSCAPYKVTSSKAGNGIISPEGVQGGFPGDNFEFYMQAGAYAYAYLYIDGELISDFFQPPMSGSGLPLGHLWYHSLYDPQFKFVAQTGSFLFKNISGDHSIHVHYRDYKFFYTHTDYPGEFIEMVSVSSPPPPPLPFPPDGPPPPFPDPPPAPDDPPPGGGGGGGVLPEPCGCCNGTPDEYGVPCTNSDTKRCAQPLTILGRPFGNGRTMMCEGLTPITCGAKYYCSLSDGWCCTPEGCTKVNKCTCDNWPGATWHGSSEESCKSECYCTACCKDGYCDKPPRLGVAKGMCEKRKGVCMSDCTDCKEGDSCCKGNQGCGSEDGCECGKDCCCCPCGQHCGMRDGEWACIESKCTDPESGCYNV